VKIISTTRVRRVVMIKTRMRMRTKTKTRTRTKTKTRITFSKILSEKGTRRGQSKM